MAYAWNPTMGAPQNYDQWVSYHQQRGDYIANDAQRQAAYHAYATAHGLPTPWVKPAVTPQPVAGEAPPDFRYLDAQGLAETSAAQHRYDLAMGTAGLPGSLQDARTQALADIAVGRINSELGYSDQMRASSRNASSRGLFNSGIRRFRDARNLANLRQAMSGFDLRANQAENAFQRGASEAGSNLALDKQTALSNSAPRNMDVWYKSRGIA